MLHIIRRNFSGSHTQGHSLRQTTIIGAQELKNLIDQKTQNLRIIDTTIPTPWGGPQNSKESYEKERIADASYLSVDQVKDHSSSLPHMIPTNEEFRKYVSQERIRADTSVVVYDQHGMFSAPRVWFMFRVFGHTNVRVLDGGLPVWKKIGLPLNSDSPVKSSSSPELTEEEMMKFEKMEKQVIDMEGVNKVAQHNLGLPLEKWSSIIIDNRSGARYRAEVKEPRPNCRAGCVPSALNLPFSQVLDEDNCFKSDEEIMTLFKEANINTNKELIWYCGSGLTACIPLLAAHLIGAKNQVLYDGAWCEYGSYPPPKFSQN